METGEIAAAVGGGIAGLTTGIVRLLGLSSRLTKLEKLVATLRQDLDAKPRVRTAGRSERKDDSRLRDELDELRADFDRHRDESQEHWRTFATSIASLTGKLELLLERWTR